jgi:hypothetical protein
MRGAMLAVRLAGVFVDSVDERKVISIVRELDAARREQGNKREKNRRKQGFSRRRQLVAT